MVRVVGTPARPVRSDVNNLPSAPAGGARVNTPAAATPVGKVGAGQAVDELETSRANIFQTLECQTRSRGMPGYAKALGGVTDTLKGLFDKPGAHWLDAGAGMGSAVLGVMEYGVNAFTPPAYRNGETIEPRKLPPKQLSVTLLDLDTPVKPQDRVNVLTGRFVEKIPDAEWPRCDLITDVEGPFSYSVRPDLVLAKYVAALKDDGCLMLGLGSTVNLNMPGKDSSVITADGKVLSYVDWLQSIPGLEVTPTPVKSNDPDDNWETMSVRIRRKPGAEVTIPPLEKVSFTEGGPPRMVLKVQGKALGQDAVTTEKVEAASRKAVDGAAAALSEGQFLDLFRGGPLSNPLASAVSGLEGPWVHVGAVPPGVLKELQTGHLSHSARYGMTDALTSLRTLGVDKLDLTAAGSADELQGKKDLGLITDHGPMSWSTRPDLVLRRYVDALHDKGEILVSLGSNGDGVGRRTRVMTRAEKELGLADWLKTVPGLDVEVETRRGDSSATDETLVRIRIKDRDAVFIRTLEPLGARESSTGPQPLWLREDLSQPPPKPQVGDVMSAFAARVWSVMR